MKLLRYGPKGKEKPGLLDANGKIRDLSKHVDDVAGKVLSPASLKKLAKLDPAKLPAVRGNRRVGDPAILISDPSRAQTEIGFKAHHSDLENIIRTSWAWHRLAHPFKTSDLSE